MNSLEPSDSLITQFYSNGKFGVDDIELALTDDVIINQLIELDLEFFPKPWGLNAWQEVFKKRRPDHLLGTICSETKILGFILFGISDPDAAHLYKILIRPEFSRKGLAGELLRQARLILSSNACKSIYLEVAQTNFAALAFYRKHGYRVLVGKSDFYGPTQHAWAMEVLLDL